MFKHLLTAILLYLCIGVHAQEKMIYPKWRIGLTPTAVLNAYPGIQLSLDKRMNEFINLTLESAYIITPVNTKQGIRLRPGVEFFLARSSWVSYAFGVHFTYRYIEGPETIRSRSFNGQFNYVSYRTSERTLAGMNISNALLFKLSKRFFLEAGGGIGTGRETYFLPGREIPGFAATGSMPFTRVSPIIYFHLNFSYAIGL